MVIRGGRVDTPLGREPPDDFPVRRVHRANGVTVNVRREHHAGVDHDLLGGPLPDTGNRRKGGEVLVKKAAESLGIPVVAIVDTNVDPDVIQFPIPGKGSVLTRCANFWFERTKDIVPNHLSDIDLADVVTDEDERAALGDRAIVIKRLKPLPVEAVVRGYLIGSGWKDYLASGAVCGIELPAGLRESERLPEPIFTPATKATVGWSAKRKAMITGGRTARTTCHLGRLNHIIRQIPMATENSEVISHLFE